MDLLLMNGFTFNEYENFVVSLQSDEYDHLILEKDNKIYEKVTDSYFVCIEQRVDHIEDYSHISIPSIKYVYQLENLIQLLEGDLDFKIKLCND